MNETRKVAIVSKITYRVCGLTVSKGGDDTRGFLKLRRRSSFAMVSTSFASFLFLYVFLHALVAILLIFSASSFSSQRESSSSNVFLHVPRIRSASGVYPCYQWFLFLFFTRPFSLSLFASSGQYTSANICRLVSSIAS